jgi:hypothetical protein
VLQRAVRQLIRPLLRPAYALLLLGAVVAGVQMFNRAVLPTSVTVIGWHQDWPEFGGWSGLDVTADGAVAWIVSDGSLLARADLLRAPDGRLRGLRAQHRGFLVRPVVTTEDGPEERAYRDAESLSLLPGAAGPVPLVSFERIPRLIALPPGGAQIPRRPLRIGEGRNSGMEALATAPDGTAFTVPERPPSPGWPYALWRQDDPIAQWRRAGRIPRAGRWRAAGADIGPDGMLYLLERGVTALAFTSRVRRLDPATPDRGQVVYLSPPGRHGNLEGLGVWRDDAGRIRLLMIADDNFNSFQRGHLVEVILPR